MIARRHHLRMLAALVGSACLALSLPAAAQADNFPDRPMKLVVGFSAGGGMDALGRLVADLVSKELGQQMVVENRTGGGGSVAASSVANSTPDGYTLLLGESSLLIIAQANPNITFDPIKSFQMVAGVASLPLTVAVHPSVPAKNIMELAALAKTKPGELNYASPGIGTVHHMAIEWLQSALNFKLTHVPYRGASALVPDLMSGQVPIGVLSAPPAMQQENAGRIRVLGHTSPTPVPGAEKWPSFAQAVPGFSASPNIYVAAPAGTPKAVAQKLNAAIRKVSESQAFKDGVVKLGGVAWLHDVDSLERTLQAEARQWGELIKKANVVLK